MHVPQVRPPHAALLEEREAALQPGDEHRHAAARRGVAGGARRAGRSGLGTGGGDAARVARVRARPRELGRAAAALRLLAAVLVDALAARRVAARERGVGRRGGVAAPTPPAAAIRRVARELEPQVNVIEPHLRRDARDDHQQD